MMNIRTATAAPAVMERAGLDAPVVSAKIITRIFSAVNQDIAMANTICQVKEKVRVLFSCLLAIR
jgi:hypothetical protein